VRTTKTEAEDAPRELREGFHHLLRGPFGVRMFRNSKMKHLPPLMLQHEKHEQNPQADSRYGEEVDGDDLPNVVL
jgi:hypothetical protein